MKRYFLETSVIIDTLRGRSQTTQLLDNLEGEFTSSYICLAELYEGIHRVKESERVKEGVNDFFAGLSGIYGIDRDIAEEFGRIRAILKKKGKVIEDLDIIIAATCIVNNLTMVTYNRGHFQRIENLQILPKGEL